MHWKFSITAECTVSLDLLKTLWAYCTQTWLPCGCIRIKVAEKSLYIQFATETHRKLQSSLRKCRDMTRYNSENMPCNTLYRWEGGCFSAHVWNLTLFLETFQNHEIGVIIVTCVDAFCNFSDKKTKTKENPLIYKLRPYFFFTCRLH